MAGYDGIFNSICEIWVRAITLLDLSKALHKTPIRRVRQGVGGKFNSHSKRYPSPFSYTLEETV